ncbi:MAG: hypothetical protein AAFV32_10275 [Myxococcota bacterium]
MNDTQKKRLHDLVDALPESEVSAAQRYLEFLRHHPSDPISRMSSQQVDALNQEIERAYVEADAGLARPAKEVLLELRKRR